MSIRLLTPPCTQTVLMPCQYMWHGRAVSALLSSAACKWLHGVDAYLVQGPEHNAMSDTIRQRSILLLGRSSALLWALVYKAAGCGEEATPCVVALQTALRYRR